MRSVGLDAGKFGVTGAGDVQHAERRLGRQQVVFETARARQCAERISSNGVHRMCLWAIATLVMSISARSNKKGLCFSAPHTLRERIAAAVRWGRRRLISKLLNVELVIDGIRGLVLQRRLSEGVRSPQEDFAHPTCINEGHSCGRNQYTGQRQMSGAGVRTES